MLISKLKIGLLTAAAACILIELSIFSGCRSGVVESEKLVVTRQVTDDLGRTINMPVKITRVVSLAPNLTENIFAVGAGDRLVGVTTFCNYPEQAHRIAKIGDTMNPSIERIVALKPEIVFVSTASQIEAFTQTLALNGIAVYVTDPDSLEGVMKTLRQLGELFGTVDQANMLVRDLENRVKAVSQMTNGKKRLRVFVQISREPLFTIGKQSFLTAVLTHAGAESVTADVETAYPKLSKETALALDPDVIILSESDDNLEPNEVFRNSAVIKNGRVISIDADLLSRPGPRLVNALEQIAGEMKGFRND